MDKFEQLFIEEGFLKSFKKPLESWQDCYQRMMIRRELVFDQAKKKYAEFIKPLSQDEINQWEQEHSVKLTNDLKIYLITIGTHLLNYPLMVNDGKWEWKDGLFMDASQLINLDSQESRNNKEYLEFVNQHLINQSQSESQILDLVDHPINGSITLQYSDHSFDNETEQKTNFCLVIQGAKRGEIWVSQSNILGVNIFPLKQAFKDTKSPADFVSYLEMILNNELICIHSNYVIKTDELIELHYQTLLINEDIADKQESESWYDFYYRTNYMPLPELPPAWLEKFDF